MKILFRTRGGKFYGWGNIIRLAEIAFFFQQKKHEVLFIYEGDKFISKYLEQYSFKKIKLRADLSINEEKIRLKNLKNFSVIFIEMLEMGLDLQKFYKSKTDKLIILDDLLDKIYFADYVICCQNLRNIKNKILLSNNTKLLIGNKFFPFNKDFKKKKFSNVKLKKKSDNLLVFLGGGNYDPAYIKIALATKKMKFKKINFIVSYSNFKVLKNTLKKINNKINVLNGTNNPAKEFYNNDIAIVAGGYTKLESAIMRTPCLIISTQWHQLELADNFKKDMGCDHLGHFSRVSKKSIFKSLNKLKKLSVKKKIYNNFCKKVNHKGFENILKYTNIKNIH